MRRAAALNGAHPSAVSDAAIPQALERGQSLAQIAQAPGVTERQVQPRLQQLRRILEVPAATQAEVTVAPFDGIAELHKNHAILDQLRAACLRLLEAED